MKLIVGLGNPGNPHLNTLHNIGFAVVEALAKDLSASWTEFSQISQLSKLTALEATLLKPQTFMNQSGRSLAEIVSYFKVLPTDLWLVHDDLDLTAGELRISFDSSSAGHKGVQNIIDILGTQAFWRWRLGIGRPPTNMTAEDYVLTKPNADSKNILNASLARTVTLIKQALNQGIDSIPHSNSLKIK